MDKVKLRQAVVVEGKYDRNTLLQLVDTAVFATNGFTDMKDPALLRLLCHAAQTTGLIILTDSDGAGFLIRNTLKGMLPKEGVLHAYIPDIPGKERRKAAPGKEGKLGVEGMTPEVLLNALCAAGATIDGEAAEHRAEITAADLYRLGLSGGEGSREKRRALQRALALPEGLSSRQLLQVLNVVTTREELDGLCKPDAFGVNQCSLGPQV